VMILRTVGDVILRESIKLLCSTEQRMWNGWSKQRSSSNDGEKQFVPRLIAFLCVYIVMPQKGKRLSLTNIGSDSVRSAQGQLHT
jgi:hypothetical protein